MLTQTECLVQIEPGHPCVGTLPGVQIREERVLPKADKEALDVVMAVADEKGLKVKVYNLSTTVGRLRARFRGISRTPAVFVGEKRIDGEILRDSILNALT